MIFRRRNPAGLWSRIRATVYPRKGWRRGFDYLVQRMRRVPDSPHRIALGFGVGTFVSFSPFYTMHIPLTLLIAWILRGSLVGGFLGTFVANFATTPPIAIAAIATGNAILGREGGTLSFTDIARAFAEAFGGLWQLVKSAFGLAEAAPERLLPFVEDVFLPYLVGGTALGAVAALVGYGLCRGAVAAYQARRRRTLEASARAELAARRPPRSPAPGPAE